MQCRGRGTEGFLSCRPTRTVRSPAMAAVCAACALTTSGAMPQGRAAAVPPTVSTTAAPGADRTGPVCFAPQLSLHGSTLQPNGAGIRHKPMFKVYAAGLYLPKKAHTLTRSTPRRVPSASGWCRCAPSMPRSSRACSCAAWKTTPKRPPSTVWHLPCCRSARCSPTSRSCSPATSWTMD